VSNQAGIHVPNGTIPAEDKRAYVEMGGSHFVFLHEQTADALAMRRASPDGTILCRFYLPRWPDRDPRDWARECARWYQMAVRDPATGEQFSLQSIRAAVTPANEQNLGEEGGGWSREWYKRINDWNLAWHDEFTRATGIDRALTHWPALATGHSDDQDDLGYVGYEICRPSIEAYGVLDVHTYWDAGTVLDLCTPSGEWKRRDRNAELYGTRIGGGWRFQLAHERFSHKPIFISECGQFDVTRHDAAAEFVAWFASLRHSPYITGATPFIFRDPTGAHSHNDWGRNREIEKAVRAAIQNGAIANGSGASVPNAPPDAAGGENGQTMNLGAGFKRAVAAGLLPGFGEGETWHFFGSEDETSMAVGRDGFATWRKDTNEVVVVRDDGAIFADNGNRGDGQFKRLR
jgi:hypothetical protein